MEDLPPFEPGPELDLHRFRPSDVGEVMDEYLRVAGERGWTVVRIIHGRGRMVLARSVHAILGRHPAVERYEWSTGGVGGAGATMVWLRAGGQGGRLVQKTQKGDCLRPTGECSLFPDV